jgi:hypothetical protein
MRLLARFATRKSDQILLKLSPLSCQFLVFAPIISFQLTDEEIIEEAALRVFLRMQEFLWWKSRLRPFAFSVSVPLAQSDGHGSEDIFCFVGKGKKKAHIVLLSFGCLVVFFPPD